MEVNSQSPQNLKWHQKTWVIVLFLIFLGPVGIVLMWINNKWSKVARIIITIIIGVIWIRAFVDAMTETPKETGTSPSVTITATPTAAPKITDSSKLNALVNKSVPDANTTIQEMGYTATYLYSGVDYTSIIAGYSADEMQKWIITKLKNFDESDKKVNFEVTTAERIAAEETKKALDEKLDSTNSWIAVENYGKSQFPYGFKLHYIMDKLAEEPSDENTWFLKATATITNMYGAEAKYTCEAQVTGTSDNPQVVSFNVY